jgi:alkylation response protein AidB-like acyl-CoA dehydrogenase
MTATFSVKKRKRNSLGSMLDFSLPPELEELRARVRAVALEGVATYGAHTDSWINGYSEEFSKVLAEHGWIGMTWPTEFGGGGRPNIERIVMGEEMIKVGAPIAASWFADRQMGPGLIAYGTPDQQAEFLPGMLSGETTWCIGMSEPDSGSDLASLKTSAVRDGNEWVINGQKIWTSFAAVADYCYLIGRTSSEGPPHRGVSEIIVPMDRPGIEVRPIKDMTTNAHFCEVYFTDVRVPIENLVGVEGDAFKQTMAQLEHERGGIDRLVSNRPLFDRAVEVADTDDPRVRQEIAQLEIGYRLGRILVYREALKQAPAGFSAATKCFCTEHEQRVADFAASQLGMSATADSDLAKAINYSPAYTIMGGTSDIMRNILGERLLGLPREPRP